MNLGEINIGEYKLILTCPRWPEQYDVFLQNQQVAYLRLRSGYFYASCPDVSGNIVYEALPHGDGYFAENERNQYLNNTVEKINEWVNMTDEQRHVMFPIVND